jgi:hypothetical protein
MVQKVLGKAACKKKAAPRGKVAGKGKVSKQRKGRLAYDNSKESKESKADSKARHRLPLVHAPAVTCAVCFQEISRLINQRNEESFARKATQSGGGLSLVRHRRRAARDAARGAGGGWQTPAHRGG